MGCESLSGEAPLGAGDRTDLRPEFAAATDLQSPNEVAWKTQGEYVFANSAFYRSLWKGERPPASLADLHELPLSDKAMLRISQAEHPPFGDYLAAPQEQAVRLHRTSGTTGQAMNLAMSARDCHVTEVVGGRAQASAGLGPGHTVVHCLNYQMWMGGLTDHLTLQQTGALVIPFGVGGSELLIRTILDVGVTAISCTPSYPAVLEQVLDAKFTGVAPRDLGLQLGLFGGEAGLDDPALRSRIEDTWGLKPRNANYGVSDVFCNFAAQCEHDTRLHFMAADVLYAELIDPDSGVTVPLEPGRSGELVLTHLERQCQPLVRFRTGDILAVDDVDPCSCGRTGFRFRVVGRSDDMVVVRGLNVFPTMVSAVVSTERQLSGNYRIVLDQPPPHDVLPVVAELAPGIEPSETLANRLADNFKRDLGVTARVTLVANGHFPLTEGKTMRVLRSYE